MLRRVRHEEGFGLVELLIAMTVLVVGILALVAGCSSGMLSLKRASRASAAGALADQRMEALRGGSYAAVVPTCAATSAASAICETSATATAPDNHAYELRTSVSFNCPTAV